MKVLEQIDASSATRTVTKTEFYLDSDQIENLITEAVSERYAGKVVLDWDDYSGGGIRGIKVTVSQET